MLTSSKEYLVMETYISTVKSFLNKEEIVDVVINNLQLIHDNTVIKDHVFRRVANFLEELRNDLTIVVETDYVDKSFRDSFYTLYSTK